MAKFADAAPPLGGELGWPAFVWLVGLLEAEGSFLAPVPSSPTCPIISCRMTDRDVVERVAVTFGTSVQANDKGEYKTEYSTTIRGSRAAILMLDLKPLMGARRQAAINRALSGYSPPSRKLNFTTAEEIRRRRSNGATVSSLARDFGVARQTVHKVLDGRIYKRPEHLGWRGPGTIGGAAAAGTGLSWAQLYWLAGWLEGEGSFLSPPPSNPKVVRVSGTCCDLDVISEVGRLLRVKVARRYEPAFRAKGWSPSWRVMLTGGRAITLMQALMPIMGQRRRGQIERAISRAAAAGAVLGWHENHSHRLTPDEVILGNGGEGT